MAEMLLVAIIWAIAASQTMTADPGFSFCPSLCTCKNKRIDCQLESLPVRLPPDSFNYLSIQQLKNHAVVIPARAFQLSGKNEELHIRISMANISKISAHAFEGLEVINKLSIYSCHISSLEQYSISNINFTNRITVMNSSIGTIHPLAFHKLSSKGFYLFKDNITRLSRAAFNQVQIGELGMYKINVEHIEPNAFGLRAARIYLFKFKNSNIGSFDCNEASNETIVDIRNLSVNCSCSTVWILKNTSSFYPARSTFKCRGKPGISLLEMEDNLLVSCANQTEALDQLCSPGQVYGEIVHGVGRVRSDSTQHLFSISLFFCVWLFLLAINLFA